MEKKIGFIGSGNMASAMIGGLIKSGLVKPANITVSDIYQGSLDMVAGEYRVQTTTDNKEVAKAADILVLSVKPNIYDSVISEIKERVKNGVIIVTIAAGKSIGGVEKAFGQSIKVVRTMPNTPALVGEGMTCICANDKVSEDDMKDVIAMFNSFGKTELVDEKLMDVVTATSGSSPAYVFMLIEAMGDAAVLEGLPRDKAYKIAAQAVLGAAKMVLDTGKHPAELKDMVCSPGGTTIEAVASLEEDGFQAAVIKAMKRCADKSKKMSS
jgi:pyrroline-5-carboxylate reductase